MKSGKVILGAVAGLAAGAALGILFAPEKGSETRKKISKKREACMDDIKEKFNDVVGAFKEKFEAAKQQENEIAERGRSKMDYSKK